jgi:hypothetical protein
LEINPRKYYPADVYRKPNTRFPKNFKIDIMEMAAPKIEEGIKAKLEQMAGKLAGGGKAAEIAEKLAKALSKAKTPLDLLGVVQEFRDLANNPEVLAEVLGNVQTVGALLKKTQAMGGLLKGAAGTNN